MSTLLLAGCAPQTHVGAAVNFLFLESECWQCAKRLAAQARTYSKTSWRTVGRGKYNMPDRLSHSVGGRAFQEAWLSPERVSSK